VNKERKDAPVAWMLIGHQYSGKSTWIKNVIATDYSNNAKKFLPKIYNLDEYVKIVCDARGTNYNDSWDRNVNEANKLLKGDYTKWINEKCDLIIDRTNITKKTRMKFLKRLKQAGYEINAVIFPVLSDEEIKKRMDVRVDQKVPFDIVIGFRDRLEGIDYEERKYYTDIREIRLKG
jgi:predicted kinase